MKNLRSPLSVWMCCVYIYRRASQLFIFGTRVIFRQKFERPYLEQV
jgi:hypothetical protein